MTMPRNTSSKTTSKSAGKTAQRSRRPAPSEQDALEMLAEDHRKVTKMFDQFEKMKEDEDDEAKQTLVEQACAELTVHAQIEEEIFYPALRETLDDTDLLDEAEVEHACAKQLITELNAMQPGDDLYDAKFTVLGEYMKHHIQEEEKEIFPKVKKAKMDLDSLGEELRQRKMELREELGMAGEEEEEGEEADAAPKSKSRRSVH
jgi:hemerythrin superfamily protein